MLMFTYKKRLPKYNSLGSLSYIMYRFMLSKNV